MNTKIAEKKAITKTFAIMLGTIFLLAASQIGLFTYYMIALNSQNAKNNTTTQNLQNTINDLNASLVDLEKPMLMGIGMKTTDFRDAHTFRVTGYVVNTGQNTADNCSLEIDLTIYGQSSNYLQAEKDVQLGTLPYGNAVFVDENFSYSSGSLFGWRVLPHWNGQPFPITPLLSS
jgi:hypothetical protein